MMQHHQPSKLTILSEGDWDPHPHISDMFMWLLISNKLDINITCAYHWHAPMMLEEWVDARPNKLGLTLTQTSNITLTYHDGHMTLSDVPSLMSWGHHDEWAKREWHPHDIDDGTYFWCLNDSQRLSLDHQSMFHHSISWPQLMMIGWWNILLMSIWWA